MICVHNQDIPYVKFYSEGGFFKAHLHFPKEYPLRPPRMKFITEIWHPNSKCVLLLLFLFFSSIVPNL